MAGRLLLNGKPGRHSPCAVRQRPRCAERDGTPGRLPRRLSGPYSSHGSRLVVRLASLARDDSSSNNNSECSWTPRTAHHIREAGPPSRSELCDPAASLGAAGTRSRLSIVGRRSLVVGRLLCDDFIRLERRGTPSFDSPTVGVRGGRRGDSLRGPRKDVVRLQENRAWPRSETFRFLLGCCRSSCRWKACTTGSCRMRFVRFGEAMYTLRRSTYEEY